MSSNGSTFSAALSGANADYIASLYGHYLAAPNEVDPGWAAFFSALNDDEAAILADVRGASWGKGQIATPDARAEGLIPGFIVDQPKPLKVESPAAKAAGRPATSEEMRQATLDSIRALMLIRAYRVRGHLMADLDPLGLTSRSGHPELDPASYGFGAADLDRPIFIDNVLGLETATLREILSALQETYCGHVGVEFMHIQNPAEKAWLQERIESSRSRPTHDGAKKKVILGQLTQAEGFEKFLQVKFTGTKRFGLEGGEAMIPSIEAMLATSAKLGVKDAVLGMAHRGRLNVLTNVMQKPYVAIFSEFQGNPANPADVQGSGDVKYHLGTSADRDFDGHTIHLSLTANPSHLEAVNPVVQGKVRAKQAQLGDEENRRAAVGLLIHGDAAFAGQGLVAEGLMLSQLRGYTTGGTLHIIINNQIGFTTAPVYSRSGPHSSDVALMIQSPIFHVNGDDPDAVVHVSTIAAEYRQQFGKDVVVDIICYRRHGHNESDEPAFTQPQMYKVIKDKATTRELYAAQLASEGVMTADQTKAENDAFFARLEGDFAAATNYKPNKADWLEGKWTGMSIAPDGERRGKTAVDEPALQKIGRALTTVPDGFELNSKIARQFEAKKDMLKTGEGFDWATAEALAFGSLLLEGVPVRLSGQDVGRGTFSHRHAALTDQASEQRYVSLNHIAEGNQARFDVYESPLSEAAVLGFEYGYSLAEPKALVLWEAQFGDFVNGAQVIIDQFISSAESKWLRMSGLVMLLPHGFEGQGPEHSSARLERFLQSCAEDNMQVANCTTPASYFHILRRQIHRNFRKPLIIMTPKSLLRHKQAVSPLAMFTGDQTFHRVLYDDVRPYDAAPEKVKRVLVCSGKVYYDILAERDARNITDMPIIRLEQLYPFPEKALAEELSKYPNAEVMWVQEEPANMGAWFFVDRRIENTLKGIGHKAGRPLYAGRPEAASPATGSYKRHNAEQASLLNAALSI